MGYMLVMGRLSLARPMHALRRYRHPFFPPCQEVVGGYLLAPFVATVRPCSVAPLSPFPSQEHVRKKAVLALHWFSQLDPRREGPLTGVELERHFRTMLCDKVGRRGQRREGRDETGRSAGAG